MLLPSVSRPAFLLLFSLPPIRGVIHQARSTSIFLTRQPDNPIPSPLPPEFARSYSTQLTSSSRAESTTFWHRDHVRGPRSCIRLLDQRLLPEPPACADGPEVSRRKHLQVGLRFSSHLTPEVSPLLRSSSRKAPNPAKTHDGQPKINSLR